MNFNLKEIEKKVTIGYFEINGVEVRKGDLYELLNELEGRDGYTSAVLIYNKELRELLEELNVVKTNIRGSSYPAENYEEFYEFIEGRIFSDE